MISIGLATAEQDWRMRTMHGRKEGEGAHVQALLWHF